MRGRASMNRPLRPIHRSSAGRRCHGFVFGAEALEFLEDVGEAAGFVAGEPEGGVLFFEVGGFFFELVQLGFEGFGEGDGCW